MDQGGRCSMEIHKGQGFDGDGQSQKRQVSKVVMETESRRASCGGGGR